MRCPNCGTENRALAKFCDECATPLPRSCPSCNAENRLEAKFCCECATLLEKQAQVQNAKSKVRGNSSPRLQTPDPKPVSYTPKHLAERILAEQAAMEARGAFTGERKFITALFADIKNSMDLIEGLDPEEARAIIDPLLQLMMEAVHRYEGYVSQSMGDGIFALFGAPIACEDHPQRAIFAALRMQEEGRRYAEMLRREKGVNVQIRVGLNSGEVVVRSIHKDDLRTDYTPVGHATSLAARMETLATPGAIVVSAYTHQLAEGYFEFKPLGPARIKGVSAPLDIYEVLGPGLLQTRLQVAERRGLVRFIGRQDELLQLRQALERAKSGQGGVIGVRGSPGVGKSRLFHEFKATAMNGCLVLETFSVSHGKAYAYLPLIELLKNYFHITVQDDERRRREKITGKVLTLNRGLEDTLPYFFSLLGVEELNSPLQHLDGQIRRRRTFGAITRLLFQESLNQPLILICEDLHWIDGETQAFLMSQTEQIAPTRILLLVNYRPEYRQEWTDKPYFTQMQLEPLGRREAEELLSLLLGEQGGALRDPALRQLKRQILAKTEGNPLFMEEIIRALVEQGMLVRDRAGGKLIPLPTVTLANLQLPPTIQGVLAARIDRLSPDAKALLQTLSIIGKECPLSLVAKVAPHSDDALQQLLGQLQNAGFIYAQPAASDVTYIFVHALTQEVAYRSLLLERRRSLHEQIAREIEELFAQQLGAHYNELAHHYSQSGNALKAITYLRLAGEQAVQRSANTEAINHFTTALQLLATLPAGAERDGQELTLRLDLGVPLVVISGIAAPEVGEMYTRALALAQQSGDTTLLFPVLRGLWEFHEVRGALSTARTLGEELLTLAQQTQEATLSLVAHGALADTLLWHGDFHRARAHAEQGIAAYIPAQHRSLAFLYGGHDLGVSSSLWRALALWHLGYPDQAVQSVHQTLPLLETLAHPYSTVHTLSFSAMLHQFLRQDGAVQERVAAALMLSQEQRFTQYVAMQMILHGWVLMEQRQEEKGILRLNEGLAIWRETRAELFLPYYQALLAEAYGRVGREQEGIALLDDALARVHNGAEQWWEAELYRLKGELLLKSCARRET